MERARDAVASLCNGLFEDGVVFTSGCTEANNTVLNAVRTMGATLITSTVEHPSILEPSKALEADGFRVIRLPVDEHGIVAIEALELHLRDPSGPVILSIQSANSETGVIQPIDKIAKLVSGRADILLHTDAAQSFGKLPIKVDPLGGPHVVSVSAHKLHGPMGVGAILLADGEKRVPSLLRGGEQEGRRRAGTQALPLIAGMGAACTERLAKLPEHIEYMRVLRDQLERGIIEAVPDAIVNAASAPRLPNTSSIRFPGMDGMALVAHLDAAGVLVSQGSACSSMKPTPSHVLIAMGLSEADAFSTIRFSVSPSNTPDEIDIAIRAVVQAHEELSNFR